MRVAPRRAGPFRVESNLRFAVGALIVVAALVGIGRWAWLKVFLVNAETAVERLGKLVSTSVAAGEPVDRNVYQNFMAQQPRVGYLVFVDYRSAYRHGMVRAATLANAETQIPEDLRRMGQENLLSRLVQRGRGFRGSTSTSSRPRSFPPGTRQTRRRRRS